MKIKFDKNTLTIILLVSLLCIGGIIQFNGKSMQIWTPEDSPLTNPVSWDNCDSLNPSDGYWNQPYPNATLSIDTVDKVEGTGSVEADIINERIFCIRKIATPSLWDFTSTPILRFSIKVSEVGAPINPVLFKMREMEGGNSTEYNYGVVPCSTAGTWYTFDVDLSTPSSGSPQLSSIHQFLWWWNENGGFLTDEQMKIDNLQRGSSEGTNPLTVSISPSSNSISTGSSATFTATASGGITPYSYQWLLDDTLLSGETSSSLTLTLDNTGSYNVEAIVTDEQSTTASDTALLTVTSPQPGTTYYYLTINSSEGGTTAPKPSVYTYEAGTILDIIAEPHSNYAFSHWILDEQQNNSTSITLTMDQNHTATAHFKGLTDISTEPTSTPSSTSTTPQPGETETLLYLFSGVVIVLAVSIYMKRKHT